MPEIEIPDIVVGRLPLYLRALTRLEHDGNEYTSSQELGTRLGISPAQIRKDLSHFGEFGKQGTGYQVVTLIEHLQHILHIDREWDVALVGVGDLGRALANYNGFASRGFKISHLFDANPSKVGKVINNLPILPSADLAAIIHSARLKIAMVATPVDSAQGVTDTLVDAGILAILNYAPISLNVPEHIQIQYIDPVIHLQKMAYYVD